MSQRAVREQRTEISESRETSVFTGLLHNSRMLDDTVPLVF